MKKAHKMTYYESFQAGRRHERIEQLKIIDSAFKESWELFKKTEKFKSLILNIEKGQRHPYNENILWHAFHEGFNSSRK